MKHLFFTSLFVLFTFFSFSQKKTTTSATINFDATTSIDKLPKAENKTVVAAIHTKKGTVQFEATIKNFTFSNPRIQEHFNSKGWMSSDEFPTAVFNGTITNISAINFRKNGTYTAQVEGDLTIHGKTQKIKTVATFVISEDEINSSCDFGIQLADYGIDSPAVGAGKVARDPKISVKATFDN